MNWDKPVTVDSFQYNWPRPLNRHHGLAFNRRQWFELVGAKGIYDFNEAYINYCKIMSSPLVQALS